MSELFETFEVQFRHQAVRRIKRLAKRWSVTPGDRNHLAVEIETLCMQAVAAEELRRGLPDIDDEAETETLPLYGHELGTCVRGHAVSAPIGADGHHGYCPTCDKVMQLLPRAPQPPEAA